MSDKDRLRGILGKLATPGEFTGDGARRLRCGAVAETLAAILCEIDETILARKLVFRTDHGQVLECDVYNRRLLRLVPPAPGGLAAALAADFGPALTGADTDDMARVLEVFRHILNGAKAITVETHAPSQPVEATDLGPSAILLAQAWGVARDSARSDRDRAEKFASALNKAASAWIWIGEDGVRSASGDGASQARLDALATGAESFDGRAECRVFAPATGARLLAAKLGGHRLAAELDPEGAASIVETWRKLGL